MSELTPSPTALPSLCKALSTPPPEPTFSTLSALTEQLSKAVSCPICLEHVSDAVQLQCGHLFCRECVNRLLAMDNVRCPVCKEKTGKRMVRRAPLDFPAIVANLNLLQSVIADCGLSAPAPNPMLQDGFTTHDATSLVRLQTAQQMMQRTPAGRNPQQDVGATPIWRRCSLCPRGVDPISFRGKVEFGEILPAKGVKKSRSLFAHERCASFTLGVYEESGVVQEMERAILRSKNITCGRDACGRSRANVMCAAEGCTVSYHYPCAIVEDCTIIEDGFKMFCPTHKSCAPTIDDEDFAKVMSDPADVASMEHEDSCYLCQTGGRLLMCDTCDRVTHPACVGLKAIPEGDWSCGICTGTHVLVAEEKAAEEKARSAATLKRQRAEKDEAWKPERVRRRSSKQSVKKKARKSTDVYRRYVLSTTGLDETRKELLQATAKNKGTMVRSELHKTVSHVVISAYTTDENPRRTMKLCKAIATKTPLVCWKWVEDSANVSAWLPVEPYLHPLSWPKDEPQVFAGMRFYFGGYTGPKEKRQELTALVTIGGGSLIFWEPSAEMAPSNAPVYYIRDDDVEKGHRKELLTRCEPPSDVTIVPSAWILDRCTKHRSS